MHLTFCECKRGLTEQDAAIGGKYALSLDFIINRHNQLLTQVTLSGFMPILFQFHSFLKSIVLFDIHMFKTKGNISFTDNWCLNCYSLE